MIRNATICVVALALGGGCLEFPGWGDDGEEPAGEGVGEGAGEGTGEGEGEGEGEAPPAGAGEAGGEGEGEGEGAVDDDGVCEHPVQNPPHVGPFLDCDDRWNCRRFCSWLQEPSFPDGNCEVDCRLWNKCSDSSAYEAMAVHCPNRRCGLEPGLPTTELEPCVVEKCRPEAEACGILEPAPPTLTCSQALECIAGCGSGELFRCADDNRDCLYDAQFLPCAAYCFARTVEEARPDLKDVLHCVVGRCADWDNRSSGRRSIVYAGVVDACGTERCSAEIAACE